MKTFSTNVVFRPISAEISTVLLPWVSQTDEKFANLWPNFGQFFIKKGPFFPRAVMNAFYSQKIFGVVVALFLPFMAFLARVTQNCSFWPTLPLMAKIAFFCQISTPNISASFPRTETIKVWKVL